MIPLITKFEERGPPFTPFARLGDALIAQSCLDGGVPLITRDSDFRAFAEDAIPLHTGGEPASRFHQNDWRTISVGRDRSSRPRKRKNIAAAFARMDRAVRHCEKALLSKNLEVIYREVRSAKKSCAAALRTCWAASLEKEDVNALEYRSVLLERAISRLEERYVSLQTASSARKRRAPS